MNQPLHITLEREGCRSVRRGVWVCDYPKICTSKSLRKLREFKSVAEKKFLRKILTDDVCLLARASAARHGAKYIPFGSDIYCKVHKKTKAQIKRLMSAIRRDCAKGVERA